MLLQLVNCYVDDVQRNHYFSYIQEIHLLSRKIYKTISNYKTLLSENIKKRCFLK